MESDTKENGATEILDEEQSEKDAAETEQTEEEITAESSAIEGFNLETAVESVLFAADRPLKTPEIKTIIGNAALKAELDDALKALSEKFSMESESGIILKKVGGGWQFRTNHIYAEFIYRFYRKKPRKLSHAAMEALSIIAYRQPLTRGEVEDIRGVDSGGVIRALLDRKLVRIIGHKEEPGRPLLYATTPQFLEYVGINQLSQLPTLEEFLELSEEHRAKVAEEIDDEDTSVKQNIINELIARQFAKAHESGGDDSEGISALDDLNDAIKEMEGTFKHVADAVGLKSQTENTGETPAEGGEAVTSDGGVQPTDSTEASPEPTDENAPINTEEETSEEIENDEES